jgi:hypothetical protein
MNPASNKTNRHGFRVWLALCLLLPLYCFGAGTKYPQSCTDSHGACGNAFKNQGLPWPSTNPYSLTGTRSLKINFMYQPDLTSSNILQATMSGQQTAVLAINYNYTDPASATKLWAQMDLCAGTVAQPAPGNNNMATTLYCFPPGYFGPSQQSKTGGDKPTCTAPGNTTIDQCYVAKLTVEWTQASPHPGQVTVTVDSVVPYSLPLVQGEVFNAAWACSTNPGC